MLAVVGKDGFCLNMGCKVFTSLGGSKDLFLLEVPPGFGVENIIGYFLPTFERKLGGAGTALVSILILS